MHGCRRRVRRVPSMCPNGLNALGPIRTTRTDLDSVSDSHGRSRTVEHYFLNRVSQAAAGNAHQQPCAMAVYLPRRCPLGRVCAGAPWNADGDAVRPGDAEEWRQRLGGQDVLCGAVVDAVSGADVPVDPDVGGDVV
jgi:hypothetical protein